VTLLLKQWEAAGKLRLLLDELVVLLVWRSGEQEHGWRLGLDQLDEY
jgi:hypothetical protein